jgi:hypothetical protein
VTRELHVDRSAGFPQIRAKPEPGSGEPKLRWWENPEAGMRMLPHVTDDDLVDAVLMARAVVKLDERRWRLSTRLAERQVRVGELETQVKNLLEAARLRDQRLAAVRWLHREAVGSTCACDGPCVCSEGEPLGACDHCGQPYPCTTIRELEATR